jgi:hypothetical protein
MEHQTFADGIGRISIIDGIVRLDLISHSATETDEQGKPKAVFAHRVVMGVDQFLRATAKLGETARAVTEAQRKAAPPRPAAPQPASPQAAPQEPPMPAQTIYPNRPQTVPPQFRRETVRPDIVTGTPRSADPRRPFP